jgi:histidinol-phosphate aminotransferase
MPLSRRSFLTSALPSVATPLPAFAIAERGREAEQAAQAAARPGKKGAPPPAAPPARPPIDPNAIRLDSNENPLGPGATAMAALTKAFDWAGRYPTNAKPNSGDLREAIARKLQVRPENVVVGNGSGELLRLATRVYVSSSRHLITAAPSFESPERVAELLGLPVTRVPVDAAGRIDMDKMAQAARWAGLVFLCNPNNPTGTVHTFKTVADFVARVRKESPETAILIDEAYHDYVDDPGYGTALALALEHPNVFVTRTLSKAYGMAGLRVGYAVGQARTIEGLRRWIMTFNTNSLAQAAAVASLGEQAHIDQERARNSEVRRYTAAFFKDLGLKSTDSQTNFVFVEIGRPAKDFREACLKLGVVVGREFPPLEKTWARISLGTMDEMKKATAAFAQVLSPETAGAAPQPSTGAAAKPVRK